MMIMNKVFKTFFNRYDTDGNFHTGFVQSLDLSEYAELTMLNDLSSVIVDSFLYNELKERIILSRWKKYLKWDDTRKDFVIKPEFYTEAVVAIYVYLAKKEKFFDILRTDFSSLSANESEVINYGSKSRSNQHGQKQKTNVFDKVVVELSKGTETHTKGAHTDTETKATFTDTENIGTHTDNESVGAQTNGTTRTESIHPFDAQTWVNDNKTEEQITNGAQSNSTTFGAQSNSTVHGEQGKTNVYGGSTDMNTFGKTTNETKNRTDTETDSAYTDNETISAHIDNKTRTKVLILSPQKYFEIQKELSEKNIYTLFSEAVNECFLNDVFGFQALEKWGCIYEC